MNNSVEYILKARDLLSPVLAQASKAAISVQQGVSKVGDSTKKSMASVNDQVRKTLAAAGNSVTGLAGKNKILAQSYNAVNQHISKVENQVRNSKIPAQIRATRNEVDALNKSLGSKLSGVFSMFGGSGGIKSLLRSLGLAVGLGAILHTGAGFVGDSIGKSLERQQIQTSFNVLAGSDQKGSSLTNQLVALQRDTILGSEVFKDAQIMMGFGFQSGEVYKNLKMLGDVSMGDADKLQALTLAFSQTKAAGKLMGQDLLQYINAGFNPLQVISEKTGKSIGKLKDDMEKGKIPFPMIEKSFKDATSEGGRFNNMLAKIAETPAGKVQQLSGQWAEFKVQVGATFMPVLSQLMDMAQIWLPRISNLIEPFGEKVREASEGFRNIGSDTQSWGGYVVAVSDNFKAIRDYAYQTFDSLFKSLKVTIDLIKQSQILKDSFGLIGDGLEAVAWLVERFVNDIKVTIERISWAFGYVEKAYKWMQGNKDQFEAEHFGKGAGINPNAQVVPAALSNNPYAQSQFMMQWSANNPVLKQSVSPLLPGMVSQKKKDGDSKYKPNDSISNVAGSGSKPTNITINLNKEMVGQITINPVTMSQGVDEVKTLMMQALAQVLNSGNKIALE